MGNTGRKKYGRWKPTGTAAVIEKAKASADKFMDYLLSTMDHEVSQCCRIYQLKDVRIWAGESPDELVECLRALADHCNFPTDEEKECNVQYHLVQALSNKDLVKKLLALDLKATNAKMLESARQTSPSVIIWMQWALLALSLSMPFIKGTTKSNANRDQSQLQTSTSVATAQSHIHQDMHPAQPKMQPATSVVKLDIGSQDAVEVHQRSHQIKGKVEGKR